MVDAVGMFGDMAGVRDLSTSGSEVHLITGNVDGRDEESALIKDYDRGSNVETTHFRCTLPREPQSSPVEATVVSRFPCMTRLEGIVATGGRCFYIVDDEERVPLLITGLQPE